MNKDKIFFNDIGIVRAFCIICILIGHSFAIYTGSNYWVLPTGVDNVDFYKWINPSFISIQLQTFVFISGFLFSHQQNCKVYDTLDYIIKKAKRILLPCLLFGVIYYFLIDRCKLGKASIEYFLSGAGHLWFLPMIFCCYTMAKILWRWIKKPSLITFILISLLGLFSPFIPKLICVQTFATYFIFFILGVWCCSYKEFILDNLRKKNIGLIICFITLLLIICKCIIYYNHTFTGSSLILHGIKFLLGIFGSISCLYLANTKTINKIINIKFARWNGYYGIYIYHQFILMIFYYNFPIGIINTYLLPFVAIIITGFFSYLLVKCSLKTKFGRWLIG